MKRILLASAALALFGAAASSASAEPLPRGWFGSFEGSYARTFKQDGTPGTVDDTNGDVLNGKSKNGLGLGVTLGYRFREGWDFGVGVSGMIGFEHDTSCRNTLCAVPFSDGSVGVTNQNVTLEQDTSFFALDFTAGYDLGLGMDLGEDTTLRVFGGGRFVQFNQTQTTSVTNYPSFKNENKSIFRGAGPRLGVEGTFGVGSGFSIFGGVNGSILLGQIEREMNTSYYGAYPQARSAHFRAVYQAGGEVGVGYSLAGVGAEGGTIQIGYRADYWWNATDNTTGNQVFDDFTGATDKGDVGFHGPFMRVTFQF